MVKIPEDLDILRKIGICREWALKGLTVAAGLEKWRPVTESQHRIRKLGICAVATGICHAVKRWKSYLCCLKRKERKPREYEPSLGKPPTERGWLKENEPSPQPTSKMPRENKPGINPSYGHHQGPTFFGDSGFGESSFGDSVACSFPYGRLAHVKGPVLSTDLGSSDHCPTGCPGFGYRVQARRAGAMDAAPTALAAAGGDGGEDGGEDGGDRPDQWSLTIQARATMRGRKGRERKRRLSRATKQSRRMRTPRWRSQRLGARNTTSGLRASRNRLYATKLWGQTSQAGSSQTIYWGELREARLGPELQLGKNWDIDFLKMQISPCCLRVFSQFWQVGESFQEVKDFEGELEVCCSRWQSPFDSHWLGCSGQSHQRVFDTDWPHLPPHPGTTWTCGWVPRGGSQGRKDSVCTLSGKCLGRNFGWDRVWTVDHAIWHETSSWRGFCTFGRMQRFAGWEARRTVFQEMLAGKSLRLWHPESPVHEAHPSLPQEHFAWGSMGEPEICPRLFQFWQTRWWLWRSATFGCTRWTPSKNDKLCWEWVHQVKAVGAPPSWAPSQCSNHWFTQPWPRLLSLVTFLDSLTPFDMAGHRMELRVGPECSLASCVFWEEQLAGLEAAFKQVSQHLLAKSTPFGAALEGAKLALGQAEKAGLFRCQQGHLKQQAPPHKVMDYNRHLHHFGLVKKFNHRHLFKLCYMEAPWGHEGEASEDMDNDHQDSETPKWSINPALPTGITKVFIEEIMPPVDVQVVGHLWPQGGLGASGPGFAATFMLNPSTQCSHKHQVEKDDGQEGWLCGAVCLHCTW